MNNNSMKIKSVTYAGLLAATLVIARLIVVTYLKSDSPIGTLIGAPKELQYYIIPAITLYLIKKFGLRLGYVTALSGTMVGVMVSGLIGTYSFYVSHISVIFDYFLPWGLATLIAFAPQNSKPLQALWAIGVWGSVILSWGVSGYFAWGVKPYSASLFWGIVTFNGWAMFIIYPIMTILFINKFKNIK